MIDKDKAFPLFIVCVAVLLVFLIVGLSLYTRWDNKNFEHNKEKAIRSTQITVTSIDKHDQIPVEDCDIAFFQSILNVSV